MNKKKGFDLSINGIVILILAITMLGLGLAFLRTILGSDFNSNTDVCDKYKIYNSIGCYKEDATEEGLSCKKQYNISTYGNCIKWHPKNKCELNPEAEGCVCDEYETIVYSIYVLGSDIKIETTNKTILDYLKKNKDYNIDYAYTEPSCIKSHLPNECEKGNEDWIIDFSYSYIFNGTEFDACGNYYTIFIGEYNKVLLSENCSKYAIKKEFCRKKTIYDYSCEELKQHIFLEEDFCISKSTWKKNNQLSFCSMIPHEKLKYIYLQKGCEI